MKRFTKLQSELQKFESDLQTLKDRKEAAEVAVAEGRRKVEELNSTVAGKLADGQEVKAEMGERYEVEKAIEENTLVIAGINKRIPESQKAVDGARGRLNDRFAQLAGEWLSKEISEYDAAVDRVIQGLKRFYSVGAMLRAIGRTDAWTEPFGDVHPYLKGSRLISVRHFNRRAIFEPEMIFHCSREFSDLVFQEITDGG
jgi:hypothetical protein